MERKPRKGSLDLDKNTPGYYIRKYRLLRNLSSDELANLIGTGAGSGILQIERGDQYPKIQTRLKIAEALEIPAIWLFPELNLTEYEPATIKAPLSEYSTKELLEEIGRRCK